MKRIALLGFYGDVGSGEAVVEGDAEAAAAEFDVFARTSGVSLRHVLAARYGLDVGADVAADALLWAWEHWSEVREMGNPVGYLYRVAQSSSRRHRRWARSVVLPAEVGSAGADGVSGHEPGLEVALGRLPAGQRMAVLLVHGLGWTYQEAADAMDVPVTTVRNHLHRGLKRLRRSLGVTA